MAPSIEPSSRRAQLPATQRVAGIAPGALPGTLLGALLLAATARAQTLDGLPPAPTLAPLRWFASTDPQGQNNDYLGLQPRETRRIPLAPGTLERLWMTALVPGKLDVTLVAGPNRRQVLLSGGKAARGSLSDKAFTFFPALRGDSLAKLEQGAALFVSNHTIGQNKFFYQVAVRPAGAASAPAKPRAVARRLFKLKLAPGEEKRVETFDQPGQITEFSVASDVAGAATFEKLRLHADFDGQRAVDAPLLSLAGQVAGRELLHNAAADFDGSRLVLRWPMPFSRATIALKNEGDQPLALDIGARLGQYDAPPSPFRFCALQSAAKTRKGQPVSLLKVQGAGALVGLALHIAPQKGSARRTFAFLEGNERIVADGTLFEGTGTEDFFSSAWYFPDRPFSHPFEGLTLKTPAPPAVSAYRWLVPDAIPFRRSLQFDFEHGLANNSNDLNWTWTAIWYQKPPLSLPAPPATARAQTQVPGNDRWKLWAAVGAGVILGLASALLRRRLRR